MPLEMQLIPSATEALAGGRVADTDYLCER